MNLLKTLVLIALLISMTASTVFSQHLKDPNAALRYMMAIGFMPDLNKDDEDKLRDITDETSYKKLSFGLQEKLCEAQSQRISDLLKYAADCPDCNFMPDQSFQAGDYIPPFREFRRFARYLNAGAWKSVSEGKHEKGAGLMVATFRFGDHVENYGPMISYMIGQAIRNIALDSMKNFQAGDYKPEAKKIIVDYLKALPRPAINIKEGVVWEQKLMENILKHLSSSEEGLIELMTQLSSEDEQPVEYKASACCGNQRVMLGALEMAAMDNLKFEVYEFAAIQERLLKEEYLRNPLVCPDKGDYKLEHYLENGEDLYRITCSCGADIDKPEPVAAKTSESKPDSEKMQKLKEKALEYKSSGRFDKDFKELMEYYQKMTSIDVMLEGNLAKIEKIQNDYENRNNQLVSYVAINFHKAFGQQIELQNQVDALIK